MATNARLGTDTNLGPLGSYDILLIKTEKFPEGLIEYSFDSTPRKITGVQKVAQLFVKLLLTRKGSDALYPNRGTLFMNNVLGSNKSETNNAFISGIQSSIKDAESQVKGIFNKPKEDPASKLKQVLIQSLKSEGESTSIYLKIITEAGETAQVAIPFPQMDLPLAS